MKTVGLHPTRCAICGTEGGATELYPPRLESGHFTPRVFSARRSPDRIHYRMVRCNSCGLVRSDPVADATVLGELYRQSTLDYGAEVGNLRRTYGRYLDRLADLGALKGSLLEVGCGNGFFLAEALLRGYADVRGVEPSLDAVERAEPTLRERIVCDSMRPGLFQAETFDVVCLFQVIDHLPDPAGVLRETCRVLKPGGLVLILSHNVAAVSAKMLGERSPIIDVEHTCLFDRKTLAHLASTQGFASREVGNVWNRYSLQYLAHLSPLPVSGKAVVVRLLSNCRLGRIAVSVPLGNLYLIAQKGS